MKEIKVYKFDELPEETQRKIWEKAGWRENPFTQDNQKSWIQFIKDIFPRVVKGYNTLYRTVSCYGNSESKMNGKRLVKSLYKKLEDLPELPTGYCFDNSTYGFARKNLARIIEEKMTAEDFVECVFRNFIEWCNDDDESYNTFESFKEDALANGWEYTAEGVQI